MSERVNIFDDFYRRRLPHLRASGATYFVTWRIARNTADLDEIERDIVAAAIRHFDGQRFVLDAFVVMNDHVHVLCTPIVPYQLANIVQSWKSFSANRIQRTTGRSGSVWQSESYDRVMRTSRERFRRWRYTMRNPRTRWPSLGEYRWVWSHPSFLEGRRISAHDDEPGTTSSSS